MTETPALLTWPVLVSQLLMFGTAAFALMFKPPVTSRREDSSRPVVVVWRALALVDLAMSPLLFLETASLMAQMTWIRVIPIAPQIARETYAGRIWMWRLGAVAGLAAIAWIPARQILTSGGVFATSALLIVLGSMTSHAVDKGVVAIAIYALHQAAAGLWLGALTSLLISATNGLDAARWLEDALRGVSSVSAWSVLIIAITGPYTAFERLGWNLKLLSDSAYGRTLMVKLAIATPALMLGGYNRYRLIPTIKEASIRLQLMRSVAIECLLLLAVLAWSTILANTPPPH